MTRDELRPRRGALMAVASLDLAEPDWPRLRAVLADAAREDGWRLADCPHPHALGGGLSRDGAQVGYKQWAWTSPPEPRATFYVVAPRGDDGWRAAAEALFRRLEREWPGALAIR